jgi:hypothetical protein
MAVAPLAVAHDHALGQRHAHHVKRARSDTVLEARQRRLRGQIETLDRVAARKQLVHRIGADASRIVGVLIAAGQTVDALPHQVSQWMIHLALLAAILKTTAQRLDQAIAKALVCGRQQDPAAVTAAMGLIKSQYNRTPLKIGKQHTLCRGKISQAKVLLCRKHCLVNMFLAHQAFAPYCFVHYSG